jgi:hypothetical protein
MTATLYHVVLVHGIDDDGREIGRVVSPRGGAWFFEHPPTPASTLAECRAVCDSLERDDYAPPRGRDSIRVARLSLMAALRAEMRRQKLKETAT